MTTHAPQHRRANVLFLGSLPEPITGQSLACQVFLDELSKHHEVAVIDMAKRELVNGASSLARFFAVVRIVFDAWRRSRNADTIYLTISESLAGNAKDLLIYLACFDKLSRVVIHLHGGAGFRLLMHPRSRVHRINEWFLRRIGGVIVLGERHVKMFAGAVDEGRIHIVPNFAEDYLFADPASIERRFDDAMPLRVLYLSNLLPGKGYLELLNGFAALDPSVRRNIRLDFAGSFGGEQAKANFLARLASIPEARYHGSVTGEQKRQLFHDAHVFCLPTYYPYEGQPISILEAYASGCAAITTDHSGIGDIFSDGVNGFQVEARSSAAVAEALAAAVAAPQRLRAMGLENRRQAEKKYRADTYRTNLLGVIDSIP